MNRHPKWTNLITIDMTWYDIIFIIFAFIWVPWDRFWNSKELSLRNKNIVMNETYRGSASFFPFVLSKLPGVSHGNQQIRMVSKWAKSPFCKPWLLRKGVVEANLISLNSFHCFSIQDCIRLLHWIRLPRSKIVVPWWWYFFGKMVWWGMEGDGGGLLRQWFL